MKYRDLPLRLLLAGAALAACRHAGAAPPIKPGTDISGYAQGQLDTRRACELPPGTYFLDRPLRLPYASGVSLTGAGDCDPGAYRGQLSGHATRLIYRGPIDEPAITITSSHFRLAGFTLYGAVPNVERRGGVGLLLTKPRRGLGTGKGTVERLTLHGWSTALQIGAKPSMHNCDDTEWRGLRFSECEQAIRQVNSQAMGHRFVNPVFSGCRRALVVDGGGYTHLIRPLSFGGVLLTFTDANPGKHRVGRNNRQFVVQDLKVDAQHNGDFQLVETLGDCSADIHVVRGVISGPAASRLGGIGPGMSLTVDGLSVASGKLAPVEKISVE